jgi:hypothetical protein
MRDWWGYDKEYIYTLFYIDRAFDRDKWRDNRNKQAILSAITSCNQMLEIDPEDKYHLKELYKYLSILESIEQGNYRDLLKRNNWETSYLF